MGNAAPAFDFAAEPQTPPPPPPRNAQQEHGYGRVDVDCIVPWLEGHSYRGYPDAAGLYTPKERAVLATLVRHCEYVSGRCDLTTSAIAERAACDRSTVRAFVGGEGYRTDVDRYGNALPTGVQEGSLGGPRGLIEHVWLSPNRAQREFPRGTIARIKGRCVNRLRFATVGELVAWGRRRLRAERAARRARDTEQGTGARREKRAKRVLNNQHSKSADFHEKNQHSKTRIPSDLDLGPLERSGSSPPPVTGSAREARAEAETDDASRPATPGSGAPPAPPTPSPPAAMRTTTPMRAVARPPPSPAPAGFALRAVAAGPDESREGARASGVPPRAPVPADVQARLRRVEEIFVRALGRRENPTGKPVWGEHEERKALEARWREGGITLEELEACAYEAGADEWVRRSALSPAAAAFRNRAKVLEYASRGWKRREAAIEAALRGEARRAAEALRAAPPPPAADLRAELGALPEVRVRPSADVVREHRAEPAAALEARMRQAWLWAESEGNAFAREAVEREFVERFGRPIVAGPEGGTRENQGRNGGRSAQDDHPGERVGDVAIDPAGGVREGGQRGARLQGTWGALECGRITLRGPMSAWNHLVCVACWNQRKPTRPAVDVDDPKRQAAPCCACGAPTTSGIWIRGEAAAMACKGEGAVHVEETHR